MEKLELSFEGAPLHPSMEISTTKEHMGNANITKDHPWHLDEKPWQDYPWKKTKMHTDLECHYLYRVAKQLGSGNYLSLGAYKGLSTACLAYGLRDSGGAGGVYAVDLFTHGENARESFDMGMTRVGLWPFVTVCTGYTQDWADRFEEHGFKFKFILIDADHSYETCKLDWELYNKLLAPRGLVAFHDVNFNTVNRVIEEIDKDQWEQVDHVYRLKTFARR